MSMKGTMITAVRNEKYVTRNISHFKKVASTTVGLNLPEEEECSDEEIDPQDSSQGDVPHSPPRSD